MNSRSPTYRLLAGLLVTLLAVGVYSGYTIVQLRGLRSLQTGTIDRNRLDSLLLLRIQNSLNSLALDYAGHARSDVADTERYPLTAWQPQFRRIRTDLEDALAREEQLAVAERDPGQRRYLADSFRQFWDSLDRVFEIAANGQPGEARMQIRNSLQARQAALSTDVARLLVANNAERRGGSAAHAGAIYGGGTQRLSCFSPPCWLWLCVTSLYLVQYVRRLFQVAVFGQTVSPSSAANWRSN